MNVDLTAGIVRILKPDGTTAGTGSIVSDDGLIATCAHVVELCDAGPGDVVRAVFHDSGETREAKVEPDWWRPPNAEDVAILRMEGPLPEGVIPLPLGSSADAEGRTFHTFGFPSAKPVEGMPGKCEVIGRTTESGFPVLQLRSPEVTRGFSGAPAWDDTLHVVIGIVVSILRPDPDGRMTQTAFIIPVETLREICPALHLPDFSPYRGLEVFEADHAAYYFGREAATRELLEMLSRQDFVAVVGVSGSGKSSLVRAGLEKGLRTWPIPGLTGRSRCFVTPGSTPLLNLVLALARLPGQTPEDVASSFALPPDALAAEGETRRQANETLNTRSPQALAEALRDPFRSGGLLLIVDQFERLYTECQDDDVRRRFIETLLVAAGDEARTEHSLPRAQSRDRGVKVLLAVRADFYSLALEHPGLAQAIKKGQVTLLPMNEEELRRAIVEPARALGRTFQPGLAGRLVADVWKRAGDLPLLEFALTELWERDAGKGVLTLESYESLGYTAPDGQRFPGVQGAIAQRAEAVWQDLNDEERRAARRVFLGLVTPGPVDERGGQTAEDAGRRTWQAEWDAPAQGVVEKLVTARLLTTGQDPFSGQPTAEVAHEALIRAWPRLQRWVTDYRPFVRWYDHDLTPFLRRWLEEERHQDFLLPESMLERAQHWLAECPAELAGPPAEFIRASVERRDQARVARERLRRQITVGLAAGLFIALVLAILAGLGWQRAEEQRQMALARQLAAQAEVMRTQQANLLQLSVLLATEAMQRSPSLEADQALRNGLALLPHFVTKVAHMDTVTTIAFSPDGRYLATASEDRTVKVWEVATGREVARMQHEGVVNAVGYSPDGRYLVTASMVTESIVVLAGPQNDNTVRLWEVTTGHELARIIPSGHLSAIAFSRDGEYLATVGTELSSPSNDISSQSQGDTVQVWEATTGREVLRMGNQHGLRAVTFNPDGRYLATASDDGMARVWETITGHEITRMEHGGGVNAVAFSPDGRYVATASDDGTARVWETITGYEITRMEHGGSVNTVAFSPDGRHVATASVAHMLGGMVVAPVEPRADERTVRVWEVTTGREVTRIRHEDQVFDIAFSPDGQYLATASYDRSARLWKVATGREVVRMTHDNPVLAIAFSPDGQYVATASADSTARVWEATADYQITSMEHGGSVNAIAFSPDGRYLATASDDGTARVWETITGHEATSMEHEGGVNAIAFSPDGRYLATASDDGTARVWDPITGREIARMEHKGSVNVVAFSPDGQHLATASNDGTARVWEVTTGHEISRIDHKSFVNALILSPDGQYLVTASTYSNEEGNTAWVWEANTGRAITRVSHAIPGGKIFGLFDIDISPDGQHLATAGNDGTARVWELTTGREVMIMEHPGRVLAIAFSPDGQHVATAGGHAVKVWDMTTGGELVSMRHEDFVNGVAFSPDGRYLATRDDRGAWVWETLTGGVIAHMKHEDYIRAIAFSPNNRYLATASDDHTARIWLWQPENLITEACSRLTRNLTREEWRQYIGDEPYRPTCPSLPAPGD